MASKYRRPIDKRCPDCRNRLHIRAREIITLKDGARVTIEEEYISCSECGYVEKIEQKRIRRKEEGFCF